MCSLWFVKEDVEELKNNSGNKDVVSTAKDLMGKNCLETNVIACFNLHVLKKTGS